jgi:predicted 3-demethylubiquinone-9 3-methyltransferase (glyoxalase superfamily)
MSKISPFLWFDDQAEEAVAFYLSVFKTATAGPVSRYGDAGPGPKGQVMVASFEIDGVTFHALNGGPLYKFTEAVSFQISCKDQADVDWYWRRLTEGGGEPGPCGWLKDRFGLSWQVVPAVLPQLIGNPDPAKARRVTEAMLRMGKLDIAELEAAAAG